MRRKRADLVIEWDLTEDPGFSIHRALVNGIYAAHPPLTGFLGKVIKAIGKGIKKVVKGVTGFIGKVISSPIFKVLAPIGIGILTGGTLGIPMLGKALTGLGLPGAGIIAKAGGALGMVEKYFKGVGGILPKGVADSLARVIGGVRTGALGAIAPLVEKMIPLIKGWSDHLKPIVERIQGALKPFEKIIPEAQALTGMGAAWGDKRITAQIMGDVLSSPPEFGLMADPSLTGYIEELHRLQKIVPPLPPVSMPEIDLSHLGPPVGQFWQTVTGIPKIIPALEGVWDSIKDIWSIIKDSMIFISNWIRYTFQQSLNLIITAIGDIPRYLGAVIGQATIQLWEAMRAALQGIQGIFASLGSQIWQGLNYVVEFFRTAFSWMYQGIAGFTQYLGEILWRVGSSLWQVTANLGTAIYQGISALGTNLWNAITWVGQIVHAVFTQYLPYYLEWLWSQLKDLGLWATEIAVPAILQNAKGAWSSVEEHFKNYTYMAYSATEGLLRRFTPMTPEKAPTAAAGLLGIAVAFGLSAHTISTVAELAHPLKSMGVHYLAGFAADMGNFGTIAASTMGILVAFSLRRPMGYYVNSIFRPTQPRQMDLMMMAVKPDIDIPTFRQGMAYEGYSEEWIDRFQATMYNEPRHFELSFMMEDASASPEWLFTKARRAGYTPEDAEIFVRGLLAKVTRNQRVDLYRMAFNSFKEGYLTRGQFTSYLDALEMRPEARGYAVASAELAYRYDYIQDMVKLLTDTYVGGLMSEDDFRIAIHSLGVEDRKARLVIQKARIRFLPKVMKETKKEAEKTMREAQTKLQNLYREQYRKELITEEQYHGYLVAMGMEPRLADLTVELEAARAYEVPVDIEEKERERIAKKVQAEQVKAYKELYRRGLIDFNTLVGYLILAGIDDELALATAETEMIKQLPEA